MLPRCGDYLKQEQLSTELTSTLTTADYLPYLPSFTINVTIGTRGRQIKLPTRSAFHPCHKQDTTPE